MISEPPFVSVSTFARRLGLNARTVRSWCQRGYLPGAWQVDDGLQWLIPLTTLEEWLQKAQPADIADIAEMPCAPSATPIMKP